MSHLNPCLHFFVNHSNWVFKLKSGSLFMTSFACQKLIRIPQAYITRNTSKGSILPHLDMKGPEGKFFSFFLCRIWKSWESRPVRRWMQVEQKPLVLDLALNLVSYLNHLPWLCFLICKVGITVSSPLQSWRRIKGDHPCISCPGKS